MIVTSTPGSEWDGVSLRRAGSPRHYGERMTELPLIDVGPLLDPTSDLDDRRRVGADLDRACRTSGFLLVTGHGVDPALRDDLERLSREFFALPDEAKARIAMPLAGAAWRGWFPVGGELTAGEPDLKEGVYFGTELGARRRARRPPAYRCTAPTSSRRSPPACGPRCCAGSTRSPASARRCSAGSPSASASTRTGSRGT